MNHLPDLSTMSDAQVTETLDRLARILAHPSMNERDRPLVDAVFQQARNELAKRRP